VSLFAVTACQRAARFATSESRDWAFIQAVGGMAIHEPVRQADGTWLLPVDCDVSGTRAITNQPTTMNSGIVVRRTDTEIHDRIVELRIVTCVAGGERDALAPPADLGTPAPGTYRVRYANSDGTTVDLGTITIGG